MKKFLATLAAVATFAGSAASAQDSQNKYVFKSPIPIFYCGSYEPLTKILSIASIEDRVKATLAVYKTQQNPDAPCALLVDETGKEMFAEFYFDPEMQKNYPVDDNTGVVYQYGEILPTTTPKRYAALLQFFKKDEAGKWQPQGWYEPIAADLARSLMK